MRDACAQWRELIDTRHMGLDRVIGAWERDGVVIDPGPASTVGTLIEGLDGIEVRAILLTHIHLDHAGAHRDAVSPLPRRAGLRTRGRGPAPDRPLTAVAERRSALRERADGRSSGGRCFRSIRERVTALRGGERSSRGMEVLRVARPRRPPRRLPRSRRRQRLRRRRRRCADSAGRSDRDADAAAGDRR